MPKQSSNWKDALPTELEKAQMLMQSNVQLQQIADKTGINLVTLTQYRKGEVKLADANWSAVNKLAQMWDIVSLQPALNQQSFFEFMDDLNDWLADIKQIGPDDPLHDVVSALSTMVKSNPIMMYELYKFYQPSKND